MKITGKRSSIIQPIVVFLFVAVCSFHIIMNYSKLYEDKQFADMITCSESLSTQVYNSIMRTFSKVSPISELTSARGVSLAKDSTLLDEIMSNTQMKGIIFAPKGVIEAAYPEKEMSQYLGLTLYETFPESIDIELLESCNEPIIIGPYEVPDKNGRAMAVFNPYYTTGPEGRKYAGFVGVIVDYPQIFGNVDLSIPENKKVLCKIWRYNRYTSKIQTLLETKDPIVNLAAENSTTFQKTYFTSTFSYTFVPKYTFYQSRAFVQLVIVLFLFCLLAAFATFFIFKGIGNSHELKILKVQSKLYEVQQHTIFSLSNLVENRDSDTGEHVRRTSDYVYMIATEARAAGLYKDILTEDYITKLKFAAPMHDIGKIVVPDAVLKKPGKLTPEEFDIIKTHTVAGAKIINDILGPVQTKEFVTVTQEIASGHHEKWNGKGYPYGLKEQEIPLSARIMALADVFDALTTPRCYKEPFPFEKAIEIIKEDRGEAFDPILTDIFLANQDKLKVILNEYFGEKD